MKLATVKSENPRNRNGNLIVVSKNNQRAVRVPSAICTSLLEALENWEVVKPKLSQLYQSLNQGREDTSFALKVEDCIAPLPNAPGFYDGSAFLSHVFRARKSRGDEMPPSAKKTPLMYQGVSDRLLSSRAPIELMDVQFGGDFEAEFGIITTDVPRGTPSSKIAPYVALLTLFNDITYREIVKTELETKFGFLQSKPNSAFAPFVVTPDEIGDSWRDGRVNLEVRVTYNGTLFGHPHGSEMHFSFFDLAAHAARTRPLSAGSIVGGGTVSNEDKNAGFACLTEKRYQEMMDQGKLVTRWLQPGDFVEIDALLGSGSVFGGLAEKVIV